MTEHNPAAMDQPVSETPNQATEDGRKPYVAPTLSTLDTSQTRKAAGFTDGVTTFS
ncbi:hypothetical protein [Pseudomonas panipatensis]|uniref:Uncharacterized protein n=1 Tax=Pseudomonas panipatensis TaxID=428992 RepID=A0A1G8LDA7_9PSED|nr:hypothetical protein [Pseudomonas panipatensis]SDI53694.1 hypothetical protein SAMN05216272_11189 [Pseudomonas panipatensis]SMP75131.1 hypothetical protein SAMN06295951_113111 [Pseudomonas panipatensis]